MYAKKDLNSFTKRLKKLTRKYSRSSQHITNTIDSLTKDPTQGDSYPGFGDLTVRKLRIGLPEYKLGKSNGLRLLHLFIEKKKLIIPLTIYAKKVLVKSRKFKKKLKQR